MTDQHMDNVVVVEDDRATVADNDEQATAWGALCSLDGFKYIIIAIGLALSQQLTGINAIMFYGPQIFEAAGVPEQEKLLVTMAAIGTWNLISVFISFALVDRLGRRPLMLGALSAMFLATLVSGIFYIVPVSTTFKSVMLIAMTMIFIGGFESGPGPLFFVMASESFSPLIRSQGLVLCNLLAWVFNIILVFTFPLLNGAIGPGITQFILTGVCAIAILIVFFRIPETKGVEDAADKQQQASVNADDEMTVDLTIRTRVIACVMIGSLTGCLYGYQTGVVSGLTDPLTNFTVSPYRLNTTDPSLEQWFGSFFTTDILVGGMVGSFIGTPIADRSGRKTGIIVCALFGLVPTIVLAVIPNYYAALASRTVQGVAVGISCTVGPLYINEVAPVKRRGSLGTVFQLSICSSILVAQFFNFLLQPDYKTNIFPEDWYWKLQFGLGAVFPGLLLAYAIFFMPESPAWLDRDRARKRAHAASGLEEDLLTNDQLVTDNQTGMKKSPSKAELLQTPKGMEWKSTGSWNDVQQAANGMAAAIRKSFTDLTTADTNDGE